jgi:hypothetical protein
MSVPGSASSSFDEPTTLVSSLQQQIVKLQAENQNLLAQLSQHSSAGNALGAQVRQLMNRLELLETSPRPERSATVVERPENPSFVHPTKFSGSRTTLRNFRIAIEAIFRLVPGRFPTDATRIAYMATLLDGAALTWYGNLIERSDAAAQAILTNNPDFVNELENTFGDIDRQRMSQDSLYELRQRGRSFNQYLTEFQQLASQSGFNDTALTAHLLHNADTRLQAEANRVGIISTMAFRDVAARLALIDANFHREDQRRDRQRQQGNGPSINSSHPRNSSRPTSVPVAPSSSLPSSSTATPMDLSTVNRRSGPLTPAEKEERFRKGLCLYCGKPGHTADVCPSKAKWTSSTNKSNPKAKSQQ